MTTVKLHSTKPEPAEICDEENIKHQSQLETELKTFR